jgi:hypothetical protein
VPQVAQDLQKINKVSRLSRSGVAQNLRNRRYRLKSGQGARIFRGLCKIGLIFISCVLCTEKYRNWQPKKLRKSMIGQIFAFCEIVQTFKRVLGNVSPTTRTPDPIP